VPGRSIGFKSNPFLRIGGIIFAVSAIFKMSAFSKIDANIDDLPTLFNPTTAMVIFGVVIIFFRVDWKLATLEVGAFLDGALVKMGTSFLSQTIHSTHSQRVVGPHLEVGISVPRGTTHEI